MSIEEEAVNTELYHRYQKKQYIHLIIILYVVRNLQCHWILYNLQNLHSPIMSFYNLTIFQSLVVG